MQPMTLTGNIPAPERTGQTAPCDTPPVQPVNSGEIAQAKQKIFIDTLAIEGDITAAATAAGYDDDTAFFRLKQSSITFNAEWDAAIDIAYMRLESSLLSGALRAATNAITKTTASGDLRSLAIWLRIGLSLLSAHRTATGRSKGHSPGFIANAKTVLIDKLNQMRERTGPQPAGAAANE
jgi:hypothetical protein